MIQYGQRRHAFEVETTFQLDVANLSIKTLKADREELIPLDQIKSVRLRFIPTRVQRNRYECRICYNKDSELILTNEHYRGVYDFEDRSAAYNAFINELCKALQTQPDCKFYGGNSKLSNLLIWLSYFVSMGFLLMLLLFFAATLPLLALGQVLIMAFYTPTLFRYARKNRSQPFDPLEIPNSLLP